MTLGTLAIQIRTCARYVPNVRNGDPLSFLRAGETRNRHAVHLFIFPGNTLCCRVKTSRGARPVPSIRRAYAMNY